MIYKKGSNLYFEGYSLFYLNKEFLDFLEDRNRINKT